MVAGHLREKNGYYHMVLNYVDEYGKRHTPSKSTGLTVKGNKKRAEKMLSEARAAKEAELEARAIERSTGKAPAGTILFTAFLLDWLEMTKKNVEETTYGAYAMGIKSKIIPYFEEQHPGLALQDVTPKHIQDYYTYELTVRGVSANTVIHRHANIRKALQYAFKLGLIDSNPADRIERPKKEKFVGSVYEEDELNRLFEIVKGDPIELGVILGAFYGLRRSEAVGLKWDAIDFNRGTLTIKRTVTEATIDGTMKIIEQDSAKTKSSLRTLPLVGSFRDYFQKVKEAQELNKKVCGNCYNYDYDGYVFVNELGERMRPNYLTEYFPKYIAKHGMPKMRFHDLRHSCASLLLANGVPLKQIQEWLGHSDFSTTANIYAHLDYRSKISSAQAMEQGMLLPRSDDFGSRWENVTEQDKITEPDLNPVF